jgi:hypothetical protein
MRYTVSASSVGSGQEMHLRLMVKQLPSPSADSASLGVCTQARMDRRVGCDLPKWQQHPNMHLKAADGRQSVAAQQARR